jgi:putative effector of murein hydrolase LrgA (UPF0299 family)
MIRGLLILLAFQCLGELIKVATGTMLPGAVIGLMLLLAMLMLRGGPDASLERASEGLIGHLALLLMPPSVGLWFLGDRLDGQWPAIVAALFGGTLVTLLATAALLKWLMRRPSSSATQPAATSRGEHS